MITKPRAGGFFCPEGAMPNPFLKPAPRPAILDRVKELRRVPAPDVEGTTRFERAREVREPGKEEESTRRRAYLMELDPAYADVIVRRWEKFTGREAVLAESGKTFSEVAAERGVVLAAEAPAG